MPACDIARVLTIAVRIGRCEPPSESVCFYGCSIIWSSELRFMVDAWE